MVQRRLCAQPLAKRHCEGKKVFSGTINMVIPEEKRRVVRKKEQTSTAPFSGITCFLSACLPVDLVFSYFESFLAKFDNH